MSQGRYISGELVSSVYVVNMTSGGGGGGAVDSVFGRTGDVTAASGDYELFYVKKNDGNVAQTINGGGGLILADTLNVAALQKLKVQQLLMKGKTLALVDATV